MPWGGNWFGVERFNVSLGTEVHKCGKIRLLELHAQCEREVLREFMARPFKDEGQQYQQQLKDRLDSKRAELCCRNEQASSDRCSAALEKLSQELEERVREGSYSVPGGYQCLLDNQREMVERYWLVPGKGIKEFLQFKEAVGQSILQTDKGLTEKEKEMAAQRAQAKAAEREQQVLRQKEAELQQKLEDQERSYQENLRQLEEKLEGDRKKLLEEQGKMVDQKLKEKAAPLKEGFREEAQHMKEKIRQLEQQIEQIVKPL